MKQKELDAIAKKIADCAICKRKSVGLPVPGEGSADAQVVFVGEAPGKQEAKTGRPFIGRSGMFLRTMIREAGLREEDVFITSALKYLPEHVTPTPSEVAHGRIHLNAQLDVIQPKLIVSLGRIACLALLERSCEISKEHGTVIEQDGRRFFLMYHPAAALYARKLRPELEGDFQRLRDLASFPFFG